MIDFGSAATAEISRATQHSAKLYLAPHMRFEGKDVHPNSHTRSLEQLMRAVDYALGLVAWELLYRLRHTECVTLVDRSGREFEQTHRKYSTRLHWVRWEPAGLHYDDTEDIAAIGANGQDYEKVLLQCVKLCCEEPSYAADDAALRERARVYAADYGDAGSQGPEADLAYFRRTALERSLGEIELLMLQWAKEA